MNPVWFLLIGVALVAAGITFIGFAVEETVTASNAIAQNEKDFQTLLSWERDGIFGNLYGENGEYAPEWYVEEKKRRGIFVYPKTRVSWEQFADPKFRPRR